MTILPMASGAIPYRVKCHLCDHSNIQVQPDHKFIRVIITNELDFTKGFLNYDTLCLTFFFLSNLSTPHGDECGSQYPDPQ